MQVRARATCFDVVICGSTFSGVTTRSSGFLWPTFINRRHIESEQNSTFYEPDAASAAAERGKEQHYRGIMTAHFQIRVGSDVTWPLSYQATDSAVMTALHNLTSVAKVAMVGLRGAETAASLPFTATVTLASGSYTGYSFTVAPNTTTVLEVGDRVLLTTAAASVVTFAALPAGTPTYITAISVAGVSTTGITVRDQFTATSASFGLQIGTLRRSKAALPGRVSIVPAAQIVTATPGSAKVTLLPLAFSASARTSVLYVQGMPVQRVVCRGFR